MDGPTSPQETGNICLLDQLLNCHLNFLNMEKVTFEMSKQGKLLIFWIFGRVGNCKTFSKATLI